MGPSLELACTLIGVLAAAAGVAGAGSCAMCGSGASSMTCLPAMEVAYEGLSETSRLELLEDVGLPCNGMPETSCYNVLHANLWRMGREDRANLLRQACEKGKLPTSQLEGAGSGGMHDLDTQAKLQRYQALNDAAVADFELRREEWVAGWYQQCGVCSSLSASTDFDACAAGILTQVQALGDGPRLLFFRNIYPVSLCNDIVGDAGCLALFDLKLERSTQTTRRGDLLRGCAKGYLEDASAINPGGMTSMSMPDDVDEDVGIIQPPPPKAELMYPLSGAAARGYADTHKAEVAAAVADWEGARAQGDRDNSVTPAKASTKDAAPVDSEESKAHEPAAQAAPYFRAQAQAKPKSKASPKATVVDVDTDEDHGCYMCAGMSKEDCGDYLVSVTEGLQDKHALLLYQSIFSSVCTTQHTDTDCMGMLKPAFQKFNSEDRLGYLIEMCDVGVLGAMRQASATDGPTPDIATAPKTVAVHEQKQAGGVDGWDHLADSMQEVALTKEAAPKALTGPKAVTVHEQKEIVADPPTKPPTQESPPTEMPETSAVAATCTMCDDLSDKACLTALDDAVSELAEKQMAALLQNIFSTTCSSTSQCLSAFGPKYEALTDKERLTALTDSCAAGLLDTQVAPIYHAARTTLKQSQPEELSSTHAASSRNGLAWGLMLGVGCAAVSIGAAIGMVVVRTAGQRPEHNYDALP